MEEEKDNVGPYVSQVMLTVLCHPIEYTKVLIQLGHEPMAARWSRTLTGRRALVLPNMFRYMGHIRRRDGYLGLFNGLAPMLCGNVASAICTAETVKLLRKHRPELEECPDLVVDGEPRKRDYYDYCRRDLTLHVVSVTVSYPFRVVAVRMMASFVGGESAYRSTFDAIASIYRESGILGFFGGLAPKLIAETTCVVASAALAYFANKYLVKTKEWRGYTLPVLLFLTSTITYPLLLTSTCMAVCGSGLAAGNPPLMPSYRSWTDCLSDLFSRRQHKRGGSLIFRYCPDPVL